MINKLFKRISLFILVTCAAWQAHAAPTPIARLHLDRSATAPEVVLAKGGKALLPIILPVDAGKELTLAANELAKYLQQMSGAEFTVTPSATAAAGIVMGKATDYPELKLAAALPYRRIEDRQHYIFRTEKTRVLLIGATEIGASHAAYHLLELLGCRWFTPSPKWEVIPKMAELRVKADFNERPDYFMFILQAADPWGGGDWNRRNRNHASPNIWNAHNLQNMAAALKAVIDQHPEYNAILPGQKDQERKYSSWLCLSNPNVRKMLTDYTLDWFRKNPARDSFSIEPNDGDGWCVCDACKQRSCTDWLVMLANETATAMEQEFPTKFLGMLAYNRHSIPPTMPVHPQVYVLPTTAFNYSGLPFEDLLDAWRQQTTLGYLGMYDYWQLPNWHWGLPVAKSCQVGHLREKMPLYYQKGVRALQTEAIGCWGPSGLGYYVANKLAWNIDTDVDAVVDDYLAKLFGKAKPAMREFYSTMNLSPTIYITEDYIGRQYRALARARQLETDPAVTARIDGLTFYLRYVDLFRRWQAATGDGKAPAQEAMMRYVWKLYKMDDNDKLFYASWIWTYISHHGHFTWPAGMEPTLPEGKHPWKETTIYTHEDAVKINAQGVAEYQILPPLPTFSKNLAPLPWPSDLRAPVNINGGRYYLAAGADGALPVLTIKAGTPAAKTPNRWALATVQGKLLEAGSIPADEQPHRLVFKTKGPGVYYFTYTDHAPRWDVSWMPGAKVSLLASEEQPINSFSNMKAYFYVPHGVKYVICFSDYPEIELYDATGKLAYRYTGTARVAGHTVAPVAPGQDGQVWSLLGPYGRLALLSVPPYLALSPDELLAPQEVLPQPTAPTTPPKAVPATGSTPATKK